MCLHVYVIFGHSIVLICTQLILVHSVKHKSASSNLMVAIARIVLISVEAIGQAVMIYLFLKLSEPITLVDEDDSDEVLQTSVDTTFNGFYSYIRENITISRELSSGSFVDYDIGRDKSDSLMENASWRNTENGLRTAIFASFLDEGVLRKANHQKARDSFASNDRSSFSSERYD